MLEFTVLLFELYRRRLEVSLLCCGGIAGSAGSYALVPPKLALDWLVISASSSWLASWSVICNTDDSHRPGGVIILTFSVTLLLYGYCEKKGFTSEADYITRSVD
jgi:hypothetical protein